MNLADGRISRIEDYLDASPRTSAEAEQVGPFTLFVGTGPWPYYARPARHLAGAVSVADVHHLRARQREIDVPEDCSLDRLVALFMREVNTQPWKSATVEPPGIRHKIVFYDDGAAEFPLPHGERIAELHRQGVLTLNVGWRELWRGSEGQAVR